MTNEERHNQLPILSFPNSEPAVSGRALHNVMALAFDFIGWVDSVLHNLCFICNVDMIKIHSHWTPIKGSHLCSRDLVDYYFSLDMAIEIVRYFQHEEIEHYLLECKQKILKDKPEYSFIENINIRNQEISQEVSNLKQSIEIVTREHADYCDKLKKQIEELMRENNKLKENFRKVSK
jgi:phage anti-repressor protein